MKAYRIHNSKETFHCFVETAGKVIFLWNINLETITTIVEYDQEKGKIYFLKYIKEPRYNWSSLVELDINANYYYQENLKKKIELVTRVNPKQFLTHPNRIVRDFIKKIIPNESISN